MSSRVLGVATRERYRVPVLCLLVAISAMPGLALGPARACVDFLDGGRVIAADTGPPALCTQPLSQVRCKRSAATAGRD